MRAVCGNLCPACIPASTDAMIYTRDIDHRVKANIMKTAKLFRNGRSQAVRLPREFRFDGDHVFLKKVGTGVLLLPAERAWDSLVHSLSQFSEDFMAEREQPPQQRRS